MIYVIEEIDSNFDMNLTRVYESDHIDLREKYNDFIQKEANKLGIKIYGYWFEISLYDKEIVKVSKTEYNRLSKKWKKFIKTWNFEYFINHFELAKEIEFIQVLQKENYGKHSKF